MSLFNERSAKRAQGVHPALWAVAQRARQLSPVAFEISEGLRDQERQARLVAEGKSQTMNSRHIKGRALDFYVRNPDGSANWDFPQYERAAAAWKQAAAELGVPIVWGGDWKTLKDGPHIQIADDWNGEGWTRVAQAETGTMNDASFTLKQRQVLALARARRRRAEAQGNPPPEGMTAQQAAEAAMAEVVGQNSTPEARYDRMGTADRIAAGAASAIKGLPFVGEGMDEMTGAVFGEQAMDRQRRAAEAFEAANPGLAMGAQLATGIAGGLPLAGAALPGLAARAPASLAGKVLYGAGVGMGAGAAEGAVSGALRGEGGGDPRMVEAGRGAALGGAFGGVVGAAAPLVGAGVRNLAENVRARPDRAAAARMGLSPEAADITGRMVSNDGPGAVSRIAEGGPTAMIADAGPATTGLLDTAIQRAGPGGRIARDAIEDRASAAGREFQTALNDALGPPGGASVAGEAASRIRSRLYNAAYARPIDYSSAAGREIEGLLKRVPPSAIRQADALMRVEGVESLQRLVRIADDGTVSFTAMPDVRTLDYITRGLNQVAKEADGKGALGGTTPVGRAYANLSRELRAQLKEAVPEYRRAVDQAARDIGLKEARDFGELALRQNVTRGEVAETVADMGQAELGKLREGVRAYIDDVLANAKRTMANPDTDIQEGMRALRDLSSRATRQKLETILGQEPARALFKRIDRAARAFELRARTAQNSATFARQNMNEAIREMTEPGAIGELLRGSPVTAARRLVQDMTNTTPQQRRAIEERISAEIATFLTGPRGQEAQRQVGELIRLLQRQPQTQALARKIGEAAGITTAVGGYQSLSQSTSR